MEHLVIIATVNKERGRMRKWREMQEVGRRKREREKEGEKEKQREKQREKEREREGERIASAIWIVNNTS